MTIGTSLLTEGSDFGGFCMSITPYLDGLEVDPETKRVLGAALEMTRACP